MRIDPVLYTGRPAEARIPKEERCYDLLDSLKVEYARADHEHAGAAECDDGTLVLPAAVSLVVSVKVQLLHEGEQTGEAVLGCEICKNLFLTNRQMTEVWLLLMPGEKPFKTKLLSKQIGTARLSFASPEQMLQYLDITPGSVSVLGLMNDTERRAHLVIDRDLLAQEFIGMHPCINTSSLRIRTEDLLKKILPAMGHEAAFVELPWDPE